MENIQKSSWQGGEFSSVPSPPGFLSSWAVAAGWIWGYLSSRSGLCLCKSWLWREGTWDRGSHSAAFRGTLPLSWGLIRWAHTQHVPLVSSAWLTLPPEIKARWSAAVLMGRPVCACVCEYVCMLGGGVTRRWEGGSGWRVRFRLWGKGLGRGCLIITQHLSCPRTLASL